MLVLQPKQDLALVKEYQVKIRKEFFPDRGYGDPSLSTARKAISDYKRLSGAPEGMAELMLFYVEMGVKFTRAYGDIDAPFYDSMISMYERFLKLVTGEGIHSAYVDRARQVVVDTNGIGWGFHDSLEELFAEYLG